MKTYSEARLKSIVQTAADAIVSFDQEGVVDFVNPAMEQMFEYQADEILGQHINLLIPSPRRNLLDQPATQHSVLGGRTTPGIGREMVGRRKNGSTFPLKVTLGDMLLGDRRFFTGILHDMSLQKQAQTRLNQAERLAVIGQMLSVITHESRNVFQCMQVNLDLLAMDIADQPQALELVSRIQRAQDSLHHLHDELRTYAAPIVLECESCLVDELAGQVLSEVSTLNKQRQISMTPLANGCDTRCEVDRFRISQVFRNLVENSLAACPDPLNIDLVLSDGQLNGHAAVEMLYHDNGPGLNDEQQQRVFEPFFTTKTKGTGLGMAISKRIIEAHGGRIAVVSRSTPGAAFSITLPRQSA